MKELLWCFLFGVAGGLIGFGTRGGLEGAALGAGVGLLVIPSAGLIARTFLWLMDNT